MGSGETGGRGESAVAGLAIWLAVRHTHRILKVSTEISVYKGEHVSGGNWIGGPGERCRRGVGARPAHRY